MALTGLPLVQLGATAIQAVDGLVQGARQSLAGIVEQSTPSSSGVEPGRPTVQEIVARFDVNRISPREFSSLVRQLNEAGHLSDQELQQLAAIRVDLELSGADPNEAIDLVAFFHRQLSDVQRQQSEAGGNDALRGDIEKKASRIRRHLGWLQQFTAAQTGPALDTVV